MCGISERNINNNNIIVYKWHSLRVNIDIDGEVNNYPVNISFLIMAVTNTVAAVY